MGWVTAAINIIDQGISLFQGNKKQQKQDQTRAQIISYQQLEQSQSKSQRQKQLYIGIGFLILVGFIIFVWK